jgi:hypothetical protein
LGALSGNNNFELRDVSSDCDGNVTSNQMVYDLTSHFKAYGASYTLVEEKDLEKFCNGESMVIGERVQKK